ncbi:glycoside hydrolase family 28 protein [Sunxiuqinia sp. A32]|uniref:glycoside hydrolase family 28 protein n=1 Tax=Sunxiuqinia sp. A32 TaxID=3461496 RepID=UPI0040467174
MKTFFSILSIVFIYTFPVQAKNYTITDYGAVGDGITLTTKAIQGVIDKASENGGGKVIFPKGKFISGLLHLKSGVELFFEENAILFGSSNLSDYCSADLLNGTGISLNVGKSPMALLVASNVENIAISGKGTIDANGRALALNIDSLYHAGVIAEPKYNYRRMRPGEGSRPDLIHFFGCKNVSLTGVHFRNASCWGLSIEQCSNLVLDKLNIFSRAYWNNDGMDITDCKNVKITNCNVNSADDGICLKSHSPEHCNDSIYIADCTVRSSASAIKFGTASHGGFKNVTIENIQIFDTFRSAIAIESVDGGVIENIKVSNIVAKNTGNAIFIRLGHRRGEKPGTIKNIHIHDIKVQVPFGRPDIDYDMRGPEVDFFHNPFPSSIVGIPGHKIENVLIENIEIEYPGRASKGMAYLPITRLQQVPEQIEDYPEFSMFRELPAWAFYIRHAKGVTFKNIVLKLKNDDFRPAFVLDDVNGFSIESIKLPDEKQTDQIVLKNVSDVKTKVNNKLLYKIE